MRVIEDFIHFKTEKEFEKVLGLKEENFKKSLEMIYHVSKWGDDTFGELFKNIQIQVTDIPLIHTLAFMGIESQQKKVIIYLNLTAIIDSYEAGQYLTDFSFSTRKTCEEFVAFVFLHELGHLYQALTTVRCAKTISEKVEQYIKKVQKEYEEFEHAHIELLKKRKNGSISNEEEREFNRKYRLIQTEKEADEFAMKYEKIVTKK